MGVVKGAQPLALEKGDAPAVAVGAGVAATAHKPGETEADIRGHIGAHAEQFTHGWAYPKSSSAIMVRQISSDSMTRQQTSPVTGNQRG